MDTPASEQTAPDRSPLRAAIKTARPHEWVKNVLVFAGLLFSGQVDDAWAVGQALLTFVAFCAISSAGYFINDLNDVELHLLDAGHFALETNGPEMAALIRDFLGRKLPAQKAEK